MSKPNNPPPRMSDLSDRNSMRVLLIRLFIIWLARQGHVIVPDPPDAAFAGQAGQELALRFLHEEVLPLEAASSIADEVHDRMMRQMQDMILSVYGVPDAPAGE